MARVLIVDPNEADRRFEMEILESAGHQILFARSGEDGLKSFIRNGIEIVITDLEMPNGSGFEMIEAMSAMYPDVPILVVSRANASELDMAKAIGARAAFSKPASPTQLLRAVADAVPATDGHRPRGGMV